MIIPSCLFALRFWFLGIWADDQGIKVAVFLGTSRFRWDQVEWFQVKDTSTNTYTIAVMIKGRTVPFTLSPLNGGYPGISLARYERGRRKVEEMVDELNARRVAAQGSGHRT